MTDPGIALVYDDDCPNIDECREALRAALAEVGAPLTWKEWHRNADSTPSGSLLSVACQSRPTILTFVIISTYRYYLYITLYHVCRVAISATI
jgi:hypothetical protein